MGSFGMMGLMSALMGNLNMQSHVGHLDHTSSKIVNKTNSQEPEISRTDDKVVQELNLKFNYQAWNNIIIHRHGII
jgi:hypothetical protein